MSTTDWFSGQRLVLPDTSNTAVEALDGSVIAALSWDQFLVLSDLDAGHDAETELIDKLNFTWKLNYPLQCYSGQTGVP